MASRRLRGFAAAAAAVGVAMLVSGCGVRWETDHSPVPSPDETTVLRDRLAHAEQAVADAAAGSASPLAVRASTSAEAHLTALGGVYVAYPGTALSPSPSLSPLPSVSAAIADARAQAAEAATQATDPNLAFLASSIQLEWTLVQWASTADKADLVDTEERVTAPEVTDLPDSALSKVVLAHDEARFAYETLAAQEFAADREVTLARAMSHGDRAEALAALVAVDPRTPLYQLRDVDLTDPDARDALARSLELDLGWRYAALLDAATAKDRGWLFDGALDAYAAAGRTEGFAVSDIPMLPGVATRPAAVPH